MKKVSIASVVCCCICLLALTSCGEMERSMAKLTGVSRQCVEGVQYLQFSTGVSVAYNQDGTVKTCNK